MASSHSLKAQPDLRNSTGILSATMKHIAEDNPIKLAETTGRPLIEKFKCYITTPFPWIASSCFIITAAIMIVSVIFLQKLRHNIFQHFFRWDEEQPSHTQLRKEKVLRECEEQMEHEEAEWQSRKDRVICDHPNDADSLEYISGVPEEF